MNPITISALTTHILSLFERDETLRDVWVAGEVSNWKRAASGHVYFSLKDSGASIASVMWRNSAAAQRWLPQEGDQVLAHGYVGLYAERGTYQLYVNELRPAGRGQLYAAYEALKEKLAGEGLFDAERKRPIPEVTRHIGVITSRSAAAFRDILRVIAQRWPLLKITLFPTLVQGSEAPAQIAAALRTANHYSATVEALDLLLVARGGGSIEDLWSFNDEQVARAIAESALPVITGVGHETDFTIADFVADLRAPTPSAAAAAATRNRTDVLAELDAVQRWLAQQAHTQLTSEQTRLAHMDQRIARLHPQRWIDIQRQRLDDRQRRLVWSMRHTLDRQSDRLTTAQASLAALNPARVLARGYSIVQNANGGVITSPSQTEAGETLHVRASDGAYTVTRQ